MQLWTGWVGVVAFLLVYLGLVLGGVGIGWLIIGLAHAAETGPPPEAFPGTAEAAKRLALDSGQWGTLLALALAAVVAEFGLLMRSSGKIAAAVEASKAEQAKMAADHARELSEREENFSRERTEWHAQTTLLQEQRLSLLRETMVGLSNATNVMQALQSQVHERTQTTAELTGQIQSMVGQIGSLRSTIGEEMAAMQKRTRETNEQVEALGKALRANR